MNPVLCFIRARLQRRLFLWFGATILFTGVAVAAVMGAGDGRRDSYRREFERVRALTEHRFGHVWEDSAAREELARAVSEDLEVTVILTGADGASLGTFGPACGSKPLMTRVVHGGQVLGSVAICADRYRTRPLNIALPLLVTGIALWAASSAIASRLARPMGALARVAEELGAGNFSARAELGRHHYGEAAALAHTINTMAARIERHLTEQRELLATVSHELRTPLSRIRLLTEMARGKGTDAKTLDDLDREVVEIDTLVGDLLASSRIDFSMLSLRPLSAVEVAARALERAGVDAGALWVEDECEGSGDGGEAIQVMADPTLLGRVLANLIDNARKHGGGLSALRVRRSLDRVAFIAEDRGHGLPEGEEQRIFEPFYRRSENGSLGLGLSLVKRIAEAHQGRAFAENREGGGARVGVELPAAGTLSA